MLLDILKSAATEPGVSDVKVKEGDPVRVRHQSKVYVVEDTPPVSRKDILELLHINEAETGVQAASAIDMLAENEGDIDFVVRVNAARFRVSMYFTNGKRIALAMRRLADKAPALGSLGLPEAYARTLLTQSKGLILVTGETGSGKTTTLASTLEMYNETRHAHIITLEQPVEYLIHSKQCMVDQREIGRDVSDFPRGLRAALREDPDIILIGELRDAVTIKTALTAALTGHLVFGTLHTNSAGQSVERIAAEFTGEQREWVYTVLSQALLGIQSQTLVNKADGSGRVLASELLVATPDVRSAIAEGRTNGIFNAMDTGSSRGQVLLNTSLRNMVRAGTIKAEDALYATYDPVRLRKELGIA